MKHSAGRIRENSGTKPELSKRYETNPPRHPRRAVPSRLTTILPNGPAVAQARPVPNPRPSPSRPTPRNKKYGTNPPRSRHSHPAQPLKVSRITKHETRDTSESQSPAPQIFFAQSLQQLTPHHLQTTPKNLTPHATLQPRPLRIVHPINPAAPGQDSSRLLLR